jgi:glutamyl-Q tRNA(Asp) synthetase
MPDASSQAYIGRFAPSPTGHLHLGTLAAAMASYLDARQHQGQWLLRIENIDPPREIAGSSDSIIRSLDDFGFEWDGEILYQSTRTEQYQYYLQQLLDRRMAYSCCCSRKDLSDAPSNEAGESIYPGTCREKSYNAATDVAFRLLTNDEPVCFADAIQGDICQRIASAVGDFVILRKDGFFAYQLAVVVDDQLSGVTHVVRGQDLLWSTPRQIYLQQQLGFNTPAYAHIALLLDTEGQKLSKSSNNGQPPEMSITSLLQAWEKLGQQPASRDDFAHIEDFWRWATQHWQLTPQRGVVT